VGRKKNLHCEDTRQREGRNIHAPAQPLSRTAQSTTVSVYTPRIPKNLPNRSPPPAVSPRKGRQPVCTPKTTPELVCTPKTRQPVDPRKTTPDYVRPPQSALQHPHPPYTLLLRCRRRRHRPAGRLAHATWPDRPGNLSSRSASPSSDCRSHPRHTWPCFYAHSHREHTYPHSHSPCSWLHPANLLSNASSSLRCIFLGHRHATLCTGCRFNRRAPLFPLLATHQRSLGLHLHSPAGRSLHPPRLPLFVGHRTPNTAPYPQHPP